MVSSTTLQRSGEQVETNFNPENKISFSRFSDRKPRLLVVSDLESTKWGNVNGFRGKCDPKQRRANAEAFNAISQDAFIVDATGQAIESVQGHNLDQVEPFHHVDIFSTNNGMQIFTNEIGKNPTKFLEELKPETDENKDWKNYIENFLMFPGSKLLKAFRTALTKLGFSKTKEIGENPNGRTYAYQNHEVWEHGDSPIPFTLCSETNVLAALNDNTEEEIAIARNFLQKIIREVTNSLKGVRGYLAEQLPFCIFAPFVPQKEENHISKSSLIPAILKLAPDGFWSDLDAIICLGDSGNDEHLGLSEVQKPGSKQMLPVYKVIAGDKLNGVEWIPNDDRIKVSSAKGDIARELTQTVQEAT